MDPMMELTPTLYSAATLLQSAKGYPVEAKSKAQPWKEWMAIEPETKAATIVAVTSKCAYGSGNLGGF